MGSVDHPINWEPTPRLVQQAVDRQDVGLVSSSEQALVVGLLGGLAILALHILPVLHSLGLIQPRLENDPRCRLVTGGQVYNVHYTCLTTISEHVSHQIAYRRSAGGIVT